ncbi:hypothetical protein SAMN05660652_04069 [Propionivibrio dicarboxylicus]|uniref:Uncharacterized protein n=1 Tax=Propionivibrio dicarboxylicus TaxID=83767 RepID=A0A1G8NKV2_9RHOO|nr:hypothetical protein SAMN05660652_04069 [Propionivibrio dicarboxylicus]
MEASNSLKKAAVEKINQEGSSFLFGNILYFISEALPKENVYAFFTVTVNDKNYVVYSSNNG